MSELPPTPLQVDIDRDGGLYDQASEYDNARDEQNAAYTTYEENIQFTQMREQQDDAYDTYEENILITQDREAEEAQRQLKKEKIKRGIGRIASVVLMIPGIDIVAEMIDEEIISTKLNKKRRDQYKEKNGTLLGNKAKGYTSTLGKSYVENSRRFTGKSEPIIKDLEALIAEHEQRKP